MLAPRYTLRPRLGTYKKKGLGTPRTAADLRKLKVGGLCVEGQEASRVELLANRKLRLVQELLDFDQQFGAAGRRAWRVDGLESQGVGGHGLVRGFRKWGQGSRAFK